MCTLCAPCCVYVPVCVRPATTKVSWWSSCLTPVVRQFRWSQCTRHIHTVVSARRGDGKHTGTASRTGKRKRKPKLRSMTLNIPHARPHTPQRAQRHVHTLTRHALTPHRHTVRVGLDSTYSRRPVLHEASEQADTRLSELLYYFCILPHSEPVTCKCKRLRGTLYTVTGIR